MAATTGIIMNAIILRQTCDSIEKTIGQGYAEGRNDNKNPHKQPIKRQKTEDTNTKSSDNDTENGLTASDDKCNKPNMEKTTNAKPSEALKASHMNLKRALHAAAIQLRSNNNCRLPEKLVDNIRSDSGGKHKMVAETKKTAKSRCHKRNSRAASNKENVEPRTSSGSRCIRPKTTTSTQTIDTTTKKVAVAGGRRSARISIRCGVDEASDQLELALEPFMMLFGVGRPKDQGNGNVLKSKTALNKLKRKISAFKPDPRYARFEQEDEYRKSERAKSKAKIGL